MKGFQKVKISGVFMTRSEKESSPVVMLENRDKNVLPIYVGVSEAFSIQSALDGLTYPRPLTHDLLLSVLKGFDGKVEKVVIDDLNDGVFFARLFVSKNGEAYEFDSRPSDGLALAVRVKAPIFVSSEVMKSASLDKEECKVE